MLIVLLGGKFSIETEAGSWITDKSRKNVFSGLPHAVYLSRHQGFTLTAKSNLLDIAYGWCLTDQDHPIQFIDPHKVDELGIEIRGGDNATRQINSILPPGVIVIISYRLRYIHLQGTGVLFLHINTIPGRWMKTTRYWKPGLKKPISTK